MQKRTEEMARSAESQYEIATQRLRTISERLDEALASAERRIGAFQSQIEEEIEARVGELERTLRTPHA
jgi:hypothetical protein